MIYRILKFMKILIKNGKTFGAWFQIVTVREMWHKDGLLSKKLKREKFKFFCFLQNNIKKLVSFLSFFSSPTVFVCFVRQFVL